MKRTRVLIIGAAGRDFHNFNVVFRDNPDFEVVAFTAAQIPKIGGRRYPADLAGDLYPNGIPILEEADLERLVRELKVDQAILAYSDLSHETVGHLAARVLAAGADFRILGPSATMLTASRPVISVGAIRTGCGKSQTTRYVAKLLMERGLKVVAVRHPMPYGDLEAMAVQRFASLEDIDAANCTIEEREEYEFHVENGVIVYAGVDYAAILAEAEREADVILWDGGNNDWPFFRPDLEIVVTDPFRPGHELQYFPGETNFRRASVILINKANTAPKENVERIQDHVRRFNPEADVVVAASTIHVDAPEKLRGAKALVIEDGPTLTHGEMGFGAGFVAAREHGAEIVDPRPFAVGSIRELYDKYPHLGQVVPAMGYYPEQLQEFQETIARSDCDVVVVATPFHLSRLVDLGKPAVRVTYELADLEEPTLTQVVDRFLAERGLV